MAVNQHSSCIEWETFCNQQADVSAENFVKNMFDSLLTNEENNHGFPAQLTAQDLLEKYVDSFKRSTELKLQEKMIR